MKKGWKKYKIGEILKSVKNPTLLESETKYKILGLRLEGRGLFVREEKKGIEVSADKLNKIREGDFIYSRLFAWKGSFDYVRKEFDGLFVSGEFPTFEIDKEIVNINFLFYYFNQKAVWNEVEQYCIGVTKASRNRFKEQFFLSMNIELPPLPEQKRIVKIIQAVEEKQQKVNKLNQAQERDIKNLLYSTYTDIIKGVEEKPMVEVASIIRRPVQITAEENYPELGIRCFGNGTFHKPALNGIEVGTKKLFQIKTGDLVFSNVFAWEGGIAIAKENDNDRYGSHRFISCNCDLEQVKPSFLNFHFLAPKGLLDINNCSPGGAGRNKTLGLKKLEAIKVPVPKIEQQEKFEKLLHQFETLKTEKEAQEKELTVLIPSLLDKAFKGELSVNVSETTKVIPLQTASIIPKNKRSFAKQVLGGKIVSLFREDQHFTNIKFQKIQYLAEHIAEEDLNWNYYRQSAGPYDNKFMHSVFSKLKQNKWFENRNYVFHPLEKSEKINGYYQGYFESKTEKLNNLFDLLKNASEKFCEAIATIYAVWNNHIILNQPFDKGKIKQDFFDWSSRKGIVFTYSEFEQTLIWMNKHNIIPTGFGQLIKEKK